MTTLILNSFRSPGFGLTLVAESTSGVMHAAETSSYSTASHSHTSKGSRPLGSSRDREEPVILPEDIGTNTASLLLQEIVQVCLCVHDDPLLSLS